MSDIAFKVFMITFLTGYLSLITSGIVYAIGEEISGKPNPYAVFAPSVLLLGIAFGTIIADVLISAIKDIDIEIKKNRGNLYIAVGIGILAVVSIGVPILALAKA